MQLQDLEKLRRLELMRPSIAQEGAAEIAQRLVDSIADERYRRYGLFILRQMFSQSGQMELAKSIAAELPNAKSALLLASMAREFAEYEPLRASQCLGAASGLIEQEVDEFNQSAVQSTIVSVYTELRDWTKAHELARRIKVPVDKSFSLCFLAKALAKDARHDMARQVLAEAASVVESFDSRDFDQAGSLDEIAQVYFILGDRAQAREWWLRALSKAEHSQDRSKLLLHLCKAFLSIADPAHAKQAASMITNAVTQKEATALIENRTD